MRKPFGLTISLAVVLALFFVAASAHADIYPLIAGQNGLVGIVEVTNDAGGLHVKYTLFNAEMEESHLHVGESSDDFPLTGSGNPKIGKFDYSTKHNPPVPWFQYDIPVVDLPGEGPYFIAAHAVVCGTDGEITDAVIGDLELEATANIWQLPIQSGVFCPSGDPASTFVVDILDGPFAGNYDGWCIQFGDPAVNANGVPVLLYRDLNMAVLDCILNNVEEYLALDHPASAGGLTYDIGVPFPPPDRQLYDTNNTAICVWHVQWVIWDQIGALALGNPPANWNNMSNDNKRKILYLKDIVEAASCELECGDVIAIVVEPTDPTLQDVVIPVPIPCLDGCETAWGAGTEFEGRSWAMYIEYTPDVLAPPAPSKFNGLSTVWGKIKSE